MEGLVSGLEKKRVYNRHVRTSFINAICPPPPIQSGLLHASNNPKILLLTYHFQVRRGLKDDFVITYSPGEL